MADNAIAKLASRIRLKRLRALGVHFDMSKGLQTRMSAGILVQGCVASCLADRKSIRSSSMRGRGRSDMLDRRCDASLLMEIS
jgi:hypothetical protein